MAVSWNKVLEINVPEIDAQHQELFKRYDDLIDAINSGQGMDAIQKTLNFLASYVVEHFLDEEKLMEEAGYPDLEGHREIHKKFIESISRLNDRFEETGGDDQLIATLKKNIFDWLWAHIGKMDRKIGEFLNK